MQQVSKQHTQRPTYPFLQLIKFIQVAIRDSYLDMATVFFTRCQNRLIEIKHKFRRKTPRNKPSFLSMNPNLNVTIKIQIRKERLSKHLERLFFMELIDLSSLTSIWAFPEFQLTSKLLLIYSEGQTHV